MPIISSDCDYGPKEIIKNNVNGILFKNHDYKDQAKKIFKLKKNKNKFSLLGNNAKKSSIVRDLNNINKKKWLQLIKRK